MIFFIVFKPMPLKGFVQKIGNYCAEYHFAQKLIFCTFNVILAWDCNPTR